MGFSKLTSLIIGGLLATAVTGGAWSGELEFDFNSATFSNPTIVDNDFWPLSSLPRAVYFSEADDGCEVNEVVVSGATRSGFGPPYDGIDAIVVQDRQWVDEECTGDYVLVEATEDWFAQDDDGNVWYLGEDTTAWDDENDCLSRRPILPDHPVRRPMTSARPIPHATPRRRVQRTSWRACRPRSRRRARCWPACWRTWRRPSVG